jgi:hypothetical protein
MNPLFMKAAAGALALGAAGTAGHTELSGHSQSIQSASRQVVVRVYIVRPGDTLGTIAAQFCGTSSAFRSMAAASGVSNPNVIFRCYRHNGGKLHPHQPEPQHVTHPKRSATRAAAR